MINKLKNYLKKNLFSQEIYPGDWLYNRKILSWMNQPELGKQLPFPYQIFRTYSNLYFKLFQGNKLIGGRELFNFIQYLFPQKDHLKLSLSKYDVFLELSDTRFFQVVNELNSQSSDARVLCSLLKENDTFIDIGANHGSFSIVASKLLNHEGLVISIEPQPLISQALEKSLALNAGCDFTVYQVAIGDHEGEAELLIPQDTSGSAGIYPKHSGTHKYQVLQCPLKRLDDLLDWQILPGNLVVKIDVEGSEILCLSGAREMITTRKPRLILEIHPETLKAAGKTGKDLKNLLKTLGYKWYSTMREHEKIIDIDDLDMEIQRNVILSMD